MKKISQFLFYFIICSATIGFISCESEDDSDSFDFQYTGKSEFAITVKDSTYYRDNVKAFLLENGRLTFSIPNLGKSIGNDQTGKDIFQIDLAVFKQAKYPFNSDGINKNIATYNMDSKTGDFESFSTINFKSPNTGRTGVFTIKHINFTDNVFSGDFEVTLHAEPFNTVNIEPIKISGYLRNVPFERSGVEENTEYMYLEVDKRPMNDLKVLAKTTELEVSYPSEDDQDNVNTSLEKFTQISTTSNDFNYFNLDIFFSENITTGIDYQSGFYVSYTSRYGERYTDIKTNLLPGSKLKIVSIVREGNKETITGRYTFKLKNNANTTTANLERGDFVVSRIVK